MAIEESQKELIVNQLRAAGCRITKQRLVILDIILNSDPSCCKEIYREAAKIDKSIGSATVYRMVNTLEEIGVLNRKNMYQVDCTSCESQCDDADCGEPGCSGSCAACETKIVVTMDDDEKLVLTREELQKYLEAGLEAKGKAKGRKISRLAM